MTLPDLDDQICWIRGNDELASACAIWMQVDALVIDTEFVRRRTFYPIPALLQVYDGDTIAIVDPLGIDDWGALAEVLAAPGVLKIFHAASEDLEVFWRLLGVIPAPLFDTQVAAGLCGLRPSMGYNKLVQALCDIDLPKDETNSDWLARPLTDNQVRYAAYDVYFLRRVYLQLLQTAQDKNRLDWVLQGSARLGAALPTLIEPDRYYLRLKGAQRLSAQELAVARALCSWRERGAREQDLPRNWVLKDSTIVALARRKPQAVAELEGIKDLQASTVRKQGRRLLELVGQAIQLPREQWPEPLPDTLQPAARASLECVKNAVQACADELDIAPELLMNRKQMSETTLRLLGDESQILPADIGQWQREVLEPSLREIKCP